MTFSSLKGRPTAQVLSLVSFGIPSHSALPSSPPPPPGPVTRQGVRSLIICTDPGLSPQGGCLGTVALNPIDTVRGRRRGEENRPWLQSVGPPRQVDECPGLHDLCHPKPAESGYNELQSLENLLTPAATVGSPFQANPRAPKFPPELELDGLPPCTNTGGLSWTDPCHHLPRPFNF